ncbi:DUF6894 family protein [Rhizobium sp. LjRoot254]|uniref:DUF6894 family protein n=1 Tax=Rhizobium sp. LjRoot254 TaxID=3342297 RepID=UPI003ECF9007
MPRYFFNVIAGSKVIADLEGTNLPDIEAAKEEALKDARALMSAAMLDGWDISGRSIAIRTEEGALVLNLAFREAVRQRD